MKRLLASLLFGSLLFLASTFAGMAVFGMHGAMADMDMGMGHCEGVGCSTTPGIPQAGNDCLGHCLAVVTSYIASSSLVQNILGTIVLALAALLPSCFAVVVRPVAIFERWREWIGKIVVARSLTTVILRN